MKKAVQASEKELAKYIFFACSIFLVFFVGLQLISSLIFLMVSVTDVKSLFYIEVFRYAVIYFLALWQAALVVKNYFTLRASKVNGVYFSNAQKKKMYGAQIIISLLVIWSSFPIDLYFEAFNH